MLIVANPNGRRKRRPNNAAGSTPESCLGILQDGRVYDKCWQRVMRGVAYSGLCVEWLTADLSGFGYRRLGGSSKHRVRLNGRYVSLQSRRPFDAMSTLIAVGVSRRSPLQYDTPLPSSTPPPHTRHPIFLYPRHPAHPHPTVLAPTPLHSTPRYPWTLYGQAVWLKVISQLKLETYQGFLSTQPTQVHPGWFGWRPWQKEGEVEWGKWVRSDWRRPRR